MKDINYEQAKEILRKDASAILVDVRNIDEYNQKHLLGATLIPLNDLKKNIENIAPNKSTKIIVYCKTGKRSAEAVRILDELGYKNVYNISGGILSVNQM